MVWHFHRHKDKYKGAVLLLTLQIILGVATIFVFMKNYEHITVGEGEVEAFKPKPVALETYQVQQKINESHTQVEYDGVFGHIQFGEKRMPGDAFSNKTISFTDISIDPNKISRFLHVQLLHKQWLLDGNMFLYLMQATSEQYAKMVSDIQFLEQYAQNPIRIPSQDNFTTQVQEIETMLQKEHYTLLVKKLQEYENSLQEAVVMTTGQSLTANFIGTNEFSYLRDKLHIDTRNMYADTIAKASETFSLSPNLIKAAIMTEQIRGFFTYRGMMKQIIATQKYMMVMQQASRGIGGVKEKTARQIESFIEQKYPDEFQVYFSNHGQTWTDNDRFAKLTDTQDYTYQIFYVAANLAMNIQQRKDAGYDISMQPGVVLTLYNIGMRNPHEKPDLGGAVIHIANQKFSFGGLGMMLYYLMEIYG
jgi:hypothetical protein